jgi:hypothetical protein
MKISEWLSKEKDWTTSLNEHETNYEMGWKIVMMGGMGCNIGLEKDIDRINIIGNGQLSTEDAKKYKLVPKDKKDLFWIDLRMSVLPLGVQISPRPNHESLEKIQIGKVIYFDGLSQNNLIDGLLKVTDALEIIELRISLFSRIVSQTNRQG